MEIQFRIRKTNNEHLLITHQSATTVDKLTYEDIIRALRTSLGKDRQAFDKRHYRISYRDRSQKLVLVRESFTRNIGSSWRRLCVAYFEVCQIMGENVE